MHPRHRAGRPPCPARGRCGSTWAPSCAGACRARGGVQQPVLHGVVEHLREQVEDHVHGSGREAVTDELLAKVVDSARIELGRDIVAKVAERVVEPPLVVEFRVLGELRLAALPPAVGGHAQDLVAVEVARSGFDLGRWLPRAALDLTHDLLELDSSTLHRPALVICPEADGVALAVSSNLEPEGDRAAIGPSVRRDGSCGTTRHSRERTPHSATSPSHRLVRRPDQPPRPSPLARPSRLPTLGPIEPTALERCTYSCGVET